MKSAYELAMERLQKKDVDAGIEHTPLTDAQKAAIAEIRSFYESKLAEVQVLHEGRLREIFDPAERDVGWMNTAATASACPPSATPRSKKRVDRSGRGPHVGRRAGTCRARWC